jgi:pimeloyl-ACP methyl ester carboxylesterase
VTTPHFFGSASHPLFGVHTQPLRGFARTGVVLCSAIGQEGLRAHRSLRVLADQLAESGAAVLRFDYFGTGDSGGDSRAGRPAGWMEDIRVAVDHLRDLSLVQRVVLIGLRLGGLLATLAEVRAVSRLILWDPVPDGPTYLAECERSAVQHPDGEWEVFGFPLVPDVRAELATLSPGRLRRAPPDVRIVMSQSPSVPAQLGDALTARRARVDVAHIPAPPVWFDEGALGLGAVPGAILRQIVQWTT